MPTSKTLKTYFEEVIHIIRKVKEKITDDTEMIWTWYDTPEELRQLIDTHIIRLEYEDMKSLEEFRLHFAATCTFQEHSMQNGWSDEYMQWAEQFDKLYEKIKKG